MSDDARYLIDTFMRQYGAIKETLTNRRRHIDDFDRLSFHAWAIGEAINNITELVFTSKYIGVREIRYVLDEMYTMYTGFYDVNPKIHLKFKYAADAIEKLYKLTEGYVNEERFD